MATKSSDLDVLKKWITSVKAWHVIAIIAIAGAFIGLQHLRDMGSSGIDRTDYKVVAKDFISDNPRIARELGKIQSVKLLGTGGGAGKVSYNAYNIRGTKKSGMCQVTLNKNEEGLWFVKTATLMTGGAEYNIPVSRRDEKRSMKLFNK